jgi:hypothetical protein
MGRLTTKTFSSQAYTNFPVCQSHLIIIFLYIQTSTFLPEGLLFPKVRAQGMAKEKNANEYRQNFIAFTEKHTISAGDL